jgi:predicted methyltransferase
MILLGDFIDLIKKITSSSFDFIIVFQTFIRSN